MKLWIDEDLSPSLVDIAHRRGLDATCSRDRSLLGRSDPEVLRHTDSAEHMINRVVEISEAGACADFSLPEGE